MSAANKLLNHLHHSLRVGQSLYVNNNVFPYPPFRTYDLDSPVPVTRTWLKLNENEGGTSEERLTVTFETPGTFTVRVTCFACGKDSDEVEWTKDYVVDVAAAE